MVDFDDEETEVSEPFELKAALIKLVEMTDELNPQNTALEDLRLQIREHIKETGEVMNLKGTWGIVASVRKGSKSKKKIDTKRLMREMKKDVMLREMVTPFLIDTEPTDPTAVLTFGF